MKRLTKVTVVAPLRRFAKYAFILPKLYYKSQGLELLVDREALLLKSLSRQIVTRLPQEADVIFSWSSVPISFLEDRRPIFIWPDAVFPAMRDYYWDDVCERTWRAGRKQEIAALSRATKALYGSEWGASSARQLSPEKRAQDPCPELWRQYRSRAHRRTSDDPDRAPQP
jgi:hypothetical protein